MKKKSTFFLVIMNVPLFSILEIKFRTGSLRLSEDRPALDLLFFEFFSFVPSNYQNNLKRYETTKMKNEYEKQLY